MRMHVIARTLNILLPGIKYWGRKMQIRQSLSESLYSLHTYNPKCTASFRFKSNFFSSTIRMLNLHKLSLNPTSAMIYCELCFGCTTYFGLDYNNLSARGRRLNLIAFHHSTDCGIQCNGCLC